MNKKNINPYTKSKVLIVVSRFNETITRSLLESAKRCLLQNNFQASNLDIVEVPGALEIPIALQIKLNRSKYHFALALGAVIRGATPHFDFVAKEAIAGVMRVSLETNTVIPVGILTTDTAEQALERTGIKHTNKGWEAAQSAIDTVNALTLI